MTINALDLETLVQMHKKLTERVLFKRMNIIFKEKFISPFNQGIFSIEFYGTLLQKKGPYTCLHPWNHWVQTYSYSSL